MTDVTTPTVGLSVGAEQLRISDSGDVAAASATLLARYVSLLDVLAEAEVLPKGPPDPPDRPPTGWRAWLARKLGSSAASEPAKKKHSSPRKHRSRAMTRLFLERHMRSKLRDLKRAYVHREQTLRACPRDGVDAAWLKEAQESAGRFADTLTLWSNIRGLLTYLWPAVVGVFLAVVGADDVWHGLLALVGNGSRASIPTPSTLFVLLIVFVYLATPVMGAIDRTRGLFLMRSASAVARHDDGGNTSGKNTYQLEDELFSALNKPKRKEPRLDVFAAVSIFLGWAALESIVGFTFVSSVPGRAFFIAAGLMFVGFAIQAVRVGMRRQWR